MKHRDQHYRDQPGLFDHPRARTNDPITSHIAASEIVSKLPKARAAMYAAFGQARTATEAALLCQRGHGGKLETYRKRKHELARDGLITKVGKRACAVTGKIAEVFVRNRSTTKRE